MALTMTTEELDQTTEIMKRTTAKNVETFGVSERDGFRMAYDRLFAEFPEVAFYWSLATVARASEGLQ